MPPADLIDHGGDWRANYPDYLGCCASLDHNLGRIRSTLSDLGLADDTIIIYTSDHGSHFRTRNSEYKRACHEACIRIPLVIQGPGFTGGQVVDDLVSLIDMPKTMQDNLITDPAYAEARTELAERLRRRLAEAGEGAVRIGPAARG